MKFTPLIFSTAVLACATLAHAEGPQDLQPTLVLVAQAWVQPSVMPMSAGKLLAYNRGEFRGELTYEPMDGPVKPLLKENVQAMVRNREGVFVLTGLNHMFCGRGAVWHVHQTPGGAVEVSLLSKLPGGPETIEKLGTDGVRFRVCVARTAEELRAANWGPDQHKCLRLEGAAVVESDGCTMPR